MFLCSPCLRKITRPRLTACCELARGVPEFSSRLRLLLAAATCWTSSSLRAAAAALYLPSVHPLSSPERTLPENYIRASCEGAPDGDSEEFGPELRQSLMQMAAERRSPPDSPIYLFLPLMLFYPGIIGQQWVCFVSGAPWASENMEFHLSA